VPPTYENDVGIRYDGCTDLTKTIIHNFPVATVQRNLGFIRDCHKQPHKKQKDIYKLSIAHPVIVD